MTSSISAMGYELKSHTTVADALAGKHGVSAVGKQLGGEPIFPSTRYCP